MFFWLNSKKYWETPPHTWRKSDFGRQVVEPVGNTSTYVEKIEPLGPWTARRRKHLHIRGENAHTSFCEASNQETPPHTWRKSLSVIEAVTLLRNTSTYVEKIPHCLFANVSSWKHLHIRGENVQTFWIERCVLETPPHTWRKFDICTLGINFLGNTSTYVEKINQHRWGQWRD